MWFDARAQLADVLRDHPDPDLPGAGLSQMSRLSQGPDPRPSAPFVANVATVAAAPGPKPDLSDPDPARFPYGFAPGGHPKTWTGRVVSLADWRALTDWDRHGPRGAIWNGATRAWEKGQA